MPGPQNVQESCVKSAAKKWCAFIILKKESYFFVSVLRVAYSAVAAVCQKADTNTVYHLMLPFLKKGAVKQSSWSAPLRLTFFSKLLSLISPCVYLVAPPIARSRFFSDIWLLVQPHGVVRNNKNNLAQRSFRRLRLTTQKRLLVFQLGDCHDLFTVFCPYFTLSTLYVNPPNTPVAITQSLRFSRTIWMICAKVLFLFSCPRSICCCLLAKKTVPLLHFEPFSSYEYNFYHKFFE